MNSEAPQTPTSTPPAGNAASTIRPLARDIVGTLRDADDPLAFIQANLHQPQAQQVDPNAIIKQVEEKRAEEAQAAKPEVLMPEINLDEQGEPKDGVQVQDGNDEKQVDETQTEQTDEAENEENEEVISSSAENFKKLRNIVKEAKQQRAEIEAKLKETEKKLNLYETGEILPEALQEKEQRINELERYEKLLSLKTSPHYQEKYIRPLTQIQDRLGEIAKDYAIPVEVMQQALSIENRAELNRFLSSHFDDVGALEVKQLVDQAKALQTEAKQAEAEPQTALQKIMEEAEAARVARRKQDLQVMSQVSKDAWVDSLLEIRNEGDAVELIHKEGDTEYNQTFVDPIIKAAAQEYGKLVTLLAHNGLEKLPKDLAQALARMCQLAHASGVALHTRNEAVRRAEELETNVKRTTNYLRPQIGSANGHGNAPLPKQPASPREAAEQLLNKVMSK